jgi:hypothetical protein
MVAGASGEAITSDESQVSPAKRTHGRGVAMGESELAQLAEPLSNIASRKGLRFAT